jgi:hypothetical protein
MTGIFDASQKSFPAPYKVLFEATVGSVFLTCYLDYGVADEWRSSDALNAGARPFHGNAPVCRG